MVDDACKKKTHLCAGQVTSVVFWATKLVFSASSRRVQNRPILLIYSIKLQTRKFQMVGSKCRLVGLLLKKV